MSPGRLSAPCRGVKDKRARLKRMAIRRRKAIAPSGEAVGIASARSASQEALFGPIIRVMYGIRRYEKSRRILSFGGESYGSYGRLAKATFHTNTTKEDVMTGRLTAYGTRGAGVFTQGGGLRRGT